MEMIQSIQKKSKESYYVMANFIMNLRLKEINLIFK